MTPPTETFTYDHLTEVARREQRNKTISDVRKDLYRAMWECQEMLKRESEREFAADPFSTKSKLASNQLLKFQEKASQVFAFRMGKLLDMALRSAEGNRAETSRLTIEEHEIYDKVYAILKEKRSSMLEGTRVKIMETEEPSLGSMTVPDMVVEAMREEEYVRPLVEQRTEGHLETTGSEEIASPPSGTQDRPQGENEQDKATTAGCPSRTGTAPEFLVLRIVEDIPAFVGPERTYRLRKEDLVCLPSGISKALIARKKAVVVNITTG